MSGASLRNDELTWSWKHVHEQAHHALLWVQSSLLPPLQPKHRCQGGTDGPEVDVRSFHERKNQHNEMYFESTDRKQQQQKLKIIPFRLKE